MNFKDWISDYPYLIPCIYCDFWRGIGSGRKLTINQYRKMQKNIINNYDYERLPCCWYSFIYDYKTRGDPPLSGKCEHFQAKHLYEYLQEVFKK